MWFSNKKKVFYGYPLKWKILLIFSFFGVYRLAVMVAVRFLMFQWKRQVQSLSKLWMEIMLEQWLGNLLVFHGSRLIHCQSLYVADNKIAFTDNTYSKIIVLYAFENCYTRFFFHKSILFGPELYNRMNKMKEQNIKNTLVMDFILCRYEPLTLMNESNKNLIVSPGLWTATRITERWFTENAIRNKPDNRTERTSRSCHPYCTINKFGLLPIRFCQLTQKELFCLKFLM